jgi:glycosyltransferase involved in cell wall biosynthesis
MKIAMLSELFYPYLLGGGEKRYHEIAKRLVSMGHEVDVYSMKLAGAEKYEECDRIKIHRLGWPNHPMDHRSLKPLPFYLLLLLSKRIKSDIIDCNTYFPCFAGRAKGLFGKPVIATIHDVYKGHWGESLGNNNLDKIGNLIEKLVCEFKYNGIICPSNSTIKLLESNFKVNAKTRLIPNGIETRLIDNVEAGEKNPHHICYAGRLVPHKHLDDLINAVEILKNEYPDIKCSLVGDGVLRKDLEAMVKTKGLQDHIEFMGFLPDYTSMLKVMKSSSVFVNPSTREGFGIVMIEAMRCKCSVVGYVQDAYKDFCTENNSILVEERNINQMADAIRKGFSTPSLGQNGYDTAGNYDWDKIAKMTSDFYEEVSKKGV